jgi:hypothetical protein
VICGRAERKDMHYIRFLKPPRLLKGSKPVAKAKITITTDLGESFLWENVDIIVELVRNKGHVVGEGKGSGKGYTWKGRDGMRSLEVEYLLPGTKHQTAVGDLQLVVRPKDGGCSAIAFETVLQVKEEGCIMPVRSWDIDADPQNRRADPATPRAERVFIMGSRSSVHIWEETGESIARHIWYVSLDQHRYVTSTGPN